MEITCHGSNSDSWVGNFINTTVGSERKTRGSFWFCIWRLKKIAVRFPFSALWCKIAKKENVELLSGILTLNAQITTKVVCFSRRLKCLRSLYGKQCGPRPDCSYNSSVILGNYLQQTISADDIFRRIFFFAL